MATRLWVGRGFGFTAEQHPPPPVESPPPDGGGRALPVPALRSCSRCVPGPARPVAEAGGLCSPGRRRVRCWQRPRLSSECAMAGRQNPTSPLFSAGKDPRANSAGGPALVSLLRAPRILPSPPNRLSMLLNSHQHHSLHDPQGTVYFSSMATAVVCPGGSWISFPIQTPSPLCPQTFAACPPKSWCRLPTRRWSWCWGARSS